MPIIQVIKLILKSPLFWNIVLVGIPKAIAKYRQWKFNRKLKKQEAAVAQGINNHNVEPLIDEFNDNLID
jgi:hypothetical protein